ncbi:hypothetical protein [Actinomadura geliboluensis]
MAFLRDAEAEALVRDAGDLRRLARADDLPAFPHVIVRENRPDVSGLFPGLRDARLPGHFDGQVVIVSKVEDLP